MIAHLAGTLLEKHVQRLVVDVGSPAGPIPTVGNPFLVGGERPGLGPVPGLGEHTAEVLRELGVEPG